MDHSSDIAEFLTSRRARITPEQAGLASQQALDLLAGWTATPDVAHRT